MGRKKNELLGAHTRLLRAATETLRVAHEEQRFKRALRSALRLHEDADDEDILKRAAELGAVLDLAQRVER